MTTLDPTPDDAAADAAEPACDDRVALIAATRLLADGDAPADVREWAASHPRFAYMWNAIADAMDAITAGSPVAA